jgi:hypothetical protein
VQPLHHRPVPLTPALCTMKPSSSNSRQVTYGYSREVHTGCGGTVVLAHEQWQCQKCGKAPMSVLETKTVYEEKP